MTTESFAARTAVLLSLQRALLGSISPSLRGVTVGFDPGRARVICYFHGEISEDDAEVMEDAQTMMLADLWPDQEVEFKLVRCDEPLEMNRLDDWVFRRRERATPAASE